MVAFATQLGEGTNNQAELEGAIFGMACALQLGNRNILLELDSQLVLDWIMNKNNSSWIIWYHSFHYVHHLMLASFIHWEL